MINRPLNVSPAKPPANPSPTFHQLCAKWRRKRWGRKNENATGNFPYSLYFFAIKKIRALKAIRSKRNIMNEFIISSFW